MTALEYEQHYANLLPKQYRSKPIAYADIVKEVTPIIMPQNGPSDPILPLAVQNAFDLDTAVGVQLDVLGQYIGAKRTGYDFTGPVTLHDDDYRTLLKIVVQRNTMSPDTKSIQEFIHSNFSTSIQVFDNMWMHLSYFFKVQVGTDQIAEYFVKLGLLPRPLAVGMSVKNAFPAGNYFGFKNAGSATPATVSPFNTVDDYHTNRPWLGYNYGIQV